MSSLTTGDSVAIAGRLDVIERDRRFVSMAEVWDHDGRDQWQLLVRCPGIGDVLWERRFEAFAAIERRRRPDSKVWRSIVWGEIARHRERHQAPLGLLREMGIAVPPEASVRLRTSGRSTELPSVVHLSDELLWVLGLWVAEGTWLEGDHDAGLIWSCDDGLLNRVAKILDYELGVHCVRAAASPQRCAALVAHSRLAVALFRHLGFGPGDRGIPGWILGLPLARLRQFIDGYREGDGVHSGKKLGNRHEFSTVSTRLKDDLVVALARFGIVPSVGRYESTFKQRTGDRKYPFWRLTALNVHPWHPLEWDEHTTQTLDAERQGDILWARVRSISQVPATDLVYDFSVPGRENFWAGSGVMAHNTYGPRMRPQDGRVVSNFIVQALEGKPITVYGDGSQTRSFCYVEDEIRGFLALLDSDITGPCNIGNPGEFTVLELADLVLELTGSSSEIIHEPLPVDDPTQRRPDITQAREALGWEPKIALREGLERTIPYFRQRLGL